MTSTYLDSLQRAVTPYRDGAYPNFVEEHADARAFFDEDTWARLREAKASTTRGPLQGQPLHPARRLADKEPADERRPPPRLAVIAAARAGQLRPAPAPGRAAYKGKACCLAGSATVAAQGYGIRRHPCRPSSQA